MRAEGTWSLPAWNRGSEFRKHPLSGLKGQLQEVSQGLSPHGCKVQ